MGKGCATVWICVDQTLQFFTGNEQNEWLGSCTGWSVSEKCRAEIDNVLATLQNSFSKTPSLFTHGCWSIAHEQMHPLFLHGDEGVTYRKDGLLVVSFQGIFDTGTSKKPPSADHYKSTSAGIPLNFLRTGVQTRLLICVCPKDCVLGFK